MEVVEKKRLELQLKRHELAIDEGELRVLDLEAEIVKVKENNITAQEVLEEKRKEIDGLLKEG